MGVSRTQVVKFIRKGDTGDKGEQGATLRGPQAWSDCAVGYAFQAGKVGEQWIDVVLYNNNYYTCKNRIPKQRPTIREARLTGIMATGSWATKYSWWRQRYC